MATVLYAHWNDWGGRFDKELIASKQWRAVLVGGDNEKNKAAYFFSRLMHNIARSVNKLLGGKYFAERAAARSIYFLMKEACKHEADLYIAHNLGALPAAVTAAKIFGKPCGFDAEDFHRNEVSDDPNNPFVKLTTRLEKKYIPQVDYLTASSPEIADAYQKIFPGIKPITILNVFPKENSIAEPRLNSGGRLKLFWFSQTIGTNRGLTDIIGALKLIKSSPFELHLLGNCSEQIKHELLEDSTGNIHFYEPMPPDKIAEFAAQFDIGLALEPGFNINNNLALSNKIFTYLQAGLCVIASDTEAQRNFMNKYPDIGKVYRKGDTAVLSTILAEYDDQREKLQAARLSAWSLARGEMSWEAEQEKFLAVVANTLNKQ
ncbi:MAG: hypothetical protein JSU01_07315 [Bacteroidetes bacterium]|nr:hypothetical protein [Bacteroidota bacterium]